MNEFKLDTARFKSDVERFIKKNDKDFKKAVFMATYDLVKLAKLKVRNRTSKSKVKSGFLINNIVPEFSNGGLTGVVRSKASYSEAYENGTRPHTIRATNKRVLAGPYRGRPAGWRVGAKSAAMGYATYGKKVQHPGTPPHPFMYPAWKFASNKLVKYIAQAL